MTTRTAIAAELSMMLQDRIGGPEIPRVDVRMWPGVGSSWNLRAGHWPDEVDFGCTTEDLSEPWKTFGPRILAPVADELARLHSAHLTAHIRAGLNPYRPGKMAEERKPRVKDADTSPGPWSEPRKLKPAEIYLQGRELRVALEEMPLPPGAKFLPPADEPIYRLDVAFDSESARAHHLRLYGHTHGLDPYSGMRAAPVDYSGHRFDPEAISRAAGADMQDAGAGAPGAFQIIDNEQPWPARPEFPWGPCFLAVGIAIALASWIFRLLQHWNP